MESGRIVKKIVTFQVNRYMYFGKMTTLDNCSIRKDDMFRRRQKDTSEYNNNFQYLNIWRKGTVKVKCIYVCVSECVFLNVCVSVTICLCG